MTSKKRKFLKPIEFAIGAILTISLPAAAAPSINNENNREISSTINADTQSKQIQQKQLLVAPSEQKNQQQSASHYSHYSHASHSSHSSHSSHYSSSR